MQRLALLVVSVAVYIFGVPVFAQGSPVQLCVAGMQVNGGSNSDGVGRDLLIKFLSKEKPDKAVTIENVPIPPSVPEDALAIAKQKGCDYVVTTNQTNSRSVPTYSSGSMSGVSAPTFYVTTAYKLTKVSDGAEVSSGSFTASDSSSEQYAVGFTMKKIADKVTQAIRKAGPTSK